MSNRLKRLPKPTSPKLDEDLSALLDELHLATDWARPSILLAIHQSKAAQERSISELEGKLLERSINVIKVVPTNEHPIILNEFVQQSQPYNSVFFLSNLGMQHKTYDALNLHREFIIEQNLKVIFWLDREELHQLAHRAPDLWAFRHRTIEFSSRYRGTKSILPAGLLLWQNNYPANDIPAVYEKITEQETLLKKLPQDRESLPTYLDIMAELLYLYWLVGDNNKISNLLKYNSKQLDVTRSPYKNSSFLNAQAINSYDQKKYHDAVRFIEQAIESNPTQGLVWSNYGIICRAAGQSRKSIPSLKKAIKLSPNDPDKLGVLGHVYISTDKIASARTLFEQARALNPDNIHYLIDMAYCYRRLGDTAKLRATLNLISNAVKNDGYVEICWQALNGNISLAKETLQTWVSRNDVLSIFIRRDPHLHLIFGIDQLSELLMESR